jgi:hypothetical protein
MRLAGIPRAAAKARATELLALVGLDERGHHRRPSCREDSCNE